MTPVRDDDSGQFREVFEREDFLRAVEELETATTANVAEAVGCSYDLAYRRLKALEGRQRITSKRVGNSFLWFPR